ncbi:MAG: hypothetical protein R2838_08750 [Caldilineaceae bacterium]
MPAGRPEERCTVADTGGEDPSNDMLAEMAIRMADTRSPTRTYRPGATFSATMYALPRAPYYTLFGSNDNGTAEEAQEAAEYARDLQRWKSPRPNATFDKKRSETCRMPFSIWSPGDESLQAVAGCDYNDFNNDSDAYYACIEDNIAALEACDATMASQQAYEACMDNVIVGDMKQAGLELRAAFLRIKRGQEDLTISGNGRHPKRFAIVEVKSAVWKTMLNATVRQYSP